MPRDLIVDGELVLYGPVGAADGWWDESGFTAADVYHSIAGIDGDLPVRLNSGGGLVFDGMAIRNILDQHKRKGRVIIKIDGVAASMASIIAMAGDEIIMGKGSLIMIHNSSTVSWGNVKDLKKAIASLDAIDTQMVEIYADRTGEDPDDIKAMMEEETWLGGEDAVEKGFATSVAGGSTGKAAKAAAFDYRIYAHAPKHLTAMATRRGWEHAKAVAVIEAARQKPANPTATIPAAAAAPPEVKMTDTTTAAAPAANDNSAEAVKADRARVSGILNHAEAQGREALAKHLAFETDMGIEAASKALALAHKATDAAVTEESPQAHAARRAAAGGLADPASAPKAPAAKGDVSILAAAVTRANKRR